MVENLRAATKGTMWWDCLDSIECIFKAHKPGPYTEAKWEITKK